MAALVVGAAGGYISGKNTGTSPSDAAVAAESDQRTRISSRGDTVGENAPRKSSRAASVEEIYRTPGSSSRIQALMDFYAGLSAGQLAEEAEKLENLPMNERIMASILLFGRWAEEDPTAAMAFSNTMGFAGGFVRPTVLQSWASVDPENAAKYFGENPREFAMMGGGMGGRGQSGASIIAAEWARQDPTAALAWSSSLTQDKGQAMTAVVTEVAKTDPRKAADLAATMDPDDRAGAYGPIASEWGASNFAEAQAWVKSLPADQQDEALASAIRGLSSKDPQAAATAIASMAPGDARDDAVGPTVRNWAKEDPQAAQAWLMTLDSEDSQRSGMRELMPQWTAQNPAAALTFVNNQPAGPVRDSAASSYVFSNNSAEPKALMDVANLIDDDRDRARSIGVVSMRWMREDPATATIYIQQSPDIPDEMRERLIEGRGMWGGGPRGRRDRD